MGVGSGRLSVGKLKWDRRYWRDRRGESGVAAAAVGDARDERDLNDIGSACHD